MLVAMASFLPSSSSAQVTPARASNPNWQRGEHPSAGNLQMSRRMVGRVIDRLNHDQHDYGGNRVRAIQALNQAREDLTQALQYDKAHPGQ